MKAGLCSNDTHIHLNACQITRINAGRAKYIWQGIVGCGRVVDVGNLVIQLDASGGYASI